jgi:hypothetical protein
MVDTIGVSQSTINRTLARNSGAAWLSAQAVPRGRYTAATVCQDANQDAAFTGDTD